MFGWLLVFSLQSRSSQAFSVGGSLLPRAATPTLTTARWAMDTVGDSSSSSSSELSRREWFRTSCANSALLVSLSSSTLLLGVSSSPALAADGVDYKAVAEDIAKLIQADPDKGPTLVRKHIHTKRQTDT